MRDHVARPLHGHRIADPDVLALDLVLVVERRIRHDDATHRDGSKLGDGSERAGAPDLDLDGLDDRRRLLGRELMREREARRARHEAEAALQSEIVDLIDYPIDVVAERRALRLDRAIMSQHLLGRAAQPHQLVGRQAEAREGLDHAQLGRGGQRRNFAPGIGEELQRPARGHRRVELAQRAGRGVARIGKNGLSPLGLPRVDPGEVGMTQIDLATHLEHLGHICAAQLFRDGANGAHIRSHILALLAVAARRCLGEKAPLVADGAGEPSIFGSAVKAGWFSASRSRKRRTRATNS